MRKTGIGERLEQIRGQATQEDMCAELGIGSTSWGRYEREDRLPDTEFLLALRKKRGISPGWVLTGEGSMKAGQAVQEEAGAYSVSDGFVRLPLYAGIAARAGGGALVDPEAEHTVELRAFSLDWIRRELRANPADLMLHYVEGDSMDDGRGGGLQPGSVVIVDRHDTAANKDGIYVLRLGDALMVKQLQRLPGDRLEVSSYNVFYKPFQIDLKAQAHELKIIGRVLWGWTGRRF